jgi:hypothetical protein
MNVKPRACYTLLSLLVLVSTSQATPAPAIHRTVNADGVPEYFARPGDQRGAGVNLPPLRRATIDAASRRDLTPATCRGHGGVKCSSGADSDGSVVCYDGFRESAQSFNDNCASARLVLTELRQIEGVKYAIVLRNTAGVPASGVRFSYKPSIGLAVELSPVEGPETIAPYGSAEFIVSSFKKPFETEHTQLEPKYLWITCGNCG